MKRSLSILFCIGLMTVLQFCSDPCKDVNCNAGTCLEGICNCFEGYEGTNCEFEIREKFIGTWTGDISPCIPEDLGDLGDMAILSFQVTKDPADVNKFSMQSPNPLIDLSLTAVLTSSTTFDIETTSVEVALPDIPIPLSVTINGTGQFLDVGQVQLNLTFIIPLLGIIDCILIVEKI